MSDILKALLIALGAMAICFIITPFIPFFLALIIDLIIIVIAVCLFYWLVRFTFSSVGAFIIVILICILLLFIFF